VPVIFLYPALQAIHIVEEDTHPLHEISQTAQVPADKNFFGDRVAQSLQK